jgi:YHS domain-containing protein
MEEPFGLKDYSRGESIYSLDPVCGKKVDESKAAGKATHLGAEYYFCSKACKHAFEESPGTYTGVPTPMPLLSKR